MTFLAYSFLYIVIGMIFCFWFAEEIKKDSQYCWIGIFWPIVFIFMLVYLIYYVIPLKIKDAINNYETDRKPGL